MGGFFEVKFCFCLESSQRTSLQCATVTAIFKRQTNQDIYSYLYIYSYLSFRTNLFYRLELFLQCEADILFRLLFFFFGCVGSSLLHAAFSSCGERGLLFVVVRGLLIAGTSFVAEHGLQARRLSSCGTRGSVVVARGLSGCGARAQQLWCTGSVAPQHVGSSRTRARTCVPCIGRRILNHCATRGVPSHITFKEKLRTGEIIVSVIVLPILFILVLSVINDWSQTWGRGWIIQKKLRAASGSCEETM